MKYAIVESGGKQYRAVEGGTIEVDRLPVEPGSPVELDRVLLMVDEDTVVVGTPVVAGVQVKATALEHIKGPKVVTFNYRPKKHYRVKGGHRQQYTLLRIEQVGQASAKPAQKEAVVEAETAAPAEKPARVKKAPAAPKAASSAKSK